MELNEYLDYIDTLRRYHQSQNFEVSPSVWASIAPEAASDVSEMLLSRYNELENIKDEIDNSLTEARNMSEDRQAIREVFLEIGPATRAIKIQNEINWLSRFMANFTEVTEQITETDIESAMNVPLERLIGEHRLKAGRLVRCCPFHDEKTASFTVFQNNKYHCFGCQANGNSINYIQKTQNLGFIDAVKYLIKL